ncbi:MAG: glycerol-3-phosphate dehydrogenase [Friedmanniella sp.]|nr:glycerol-3-phosphate dehydrogenase [Friedmanniella sp.]
MPHPTTADAAPCPGRPDRPAVSIVGSGRVALALACALDRAGYPVRTVVHRSTADVAAFRRLLPDTLLTSEPGRATVDAEVVVLAVSDDALTEVAQTLSDQDWTGRTAVHVSGRYGADMLAPLAGRGAAVLALHPAMTFTGDVETEVSRLAETRFAVTGDASGVELGLALAETLGAGGFVVPEDQRALYHAALCHATNHLTVLLAQAADLLQRAGIDQPSTVLGPLVTAGLANTLRSGGSALTGPVSRGDVDTVAGHLGAIAATAPSVLPSYRVLAAAASELAHAQRWLTPEQNRRLHEVIENPAAGAGPL